VIFVDGRLPSRQLEEEVACTLHPDPLASYGVFVLLYGHPPWDLRKTSMSLWENVPAYGNSSQVAEAADPLSERKGEAGAVDDEGEVRRLEPEAGRMLQITVSQAVHLLERPRRE
jgi:hypothetical protein